VVSQHHIELSAGQVLFREGDAPTSAYLVERGRLRITASIGGREVVLGDVEPGALVGEVAVLDDSPRTATATVLDDCVLTTIDRAQFAERLAAADPIVRALLLSQFARYRSALATFSGRVAATAPAALATQVNALKAQDKIRLESQLREALDSGTLEMQLQPIQHIASGRIAGYEALTRWNHSERGPISPAEFIALAEETSLIVPVGDFVLDQVCSTLRRFSARWPAAAPYIGLNVSGRQIDDADFIDRVTTRAAEYAVSTTLLKIEITESLVLDYAHVAILLERCHAAGIRVAIDDFGTGYSSLAHLHRLTFDTLKLDQAFVRQLADPRCLAIVRAVVAMATALGCDIVAEGVETAEQLDCLRDLGCHYAQGYLVGKPQRIDAVLANAAWP
jgi:EAL domain-containing protein (putative c-di-GMP-specific phosphodiesterase class I)